MRNTATASFAANGATVSAPSASANVPVVELPGLAFTKSGLSQFPTVGSTVSYTFGVRNTGNVTLTNVIVTDPRIPALACTFTNLALGRTPITCFARYVLTQDDVDAGGLSNSATVSANSPLGAVIRDTSDNDGTGSSDPTAAPIAGQPSLRVVKSAGAVQMLFSTVDKVTFTLTVQNTSNTTQTGIRLVDDLAAFLAPAVLRTDIPVVVRATGFADSGGNAGYNGASFTQTLTGNPILLPGQTGTVKIDLVYSTSAGQPAGKNIGRAMSDQLTTACPTRWKAMATAPAMAFPMRRITTPQARFTVKTTGSCCRAGGFR